MTTDPMAWRLFACIVVAGLDAGLAAGSVSSSEVGLFTGCAVVAGLTAIVGAIRG